MTRRLKCCGGGLVSDLGLPRVPMHAGVAETQPGNVGFNQWTSLYAIMQVGYRDWMLCNPHSTRSSVLVQLVDILFLGGFQGHRVFDI
jgi:hypothetical protein